jgi:hypothetical protein
MDIETKIRDAFQDGDDIVKDRALEAALNEIEQLRTDAAREIEKLQREVETLRRKNSHMKDFFKSQSENALVMLQSM